MYTRCFSSLTYLENPQLACQEKEKNVCCSLITNTNPSKQEPIAEGLWHIASMCQIYCLDIITLTEIDEPTYTLLSHILQKLGNKDTQQKVKPKDSATDAVLNDSHIDWSCESQIERDFTVTWNWQQKVSGSPFWKWVICVLENHKPRRCNESWSRWLSEHKHSKVFF